MKTRRLFSFLLVLLLALPMYAGAEETLTGVLVEYRTYVDGGEISQTAVDGVDYTWQYNALTRSLWITMLRLDMPRDAVRIQAVFYDDMLGQVIYSLADPLTYSDVLDLSMSDQLPSLPSFILLRDTGESTETALQVGMSTNPPPESITGIASVGITGDFNPGGTLQGYGGLTDPAIPDSSAYVPIYQEDPAGETGKAVGSLDGAVPDQTDISPETPVQQADPAAELAQGLGELSQPLAAQTPDPTRQSDYARVNGDDTAFAVSPYILEGTINLLAGVHLRYDWSMSRQELLVDGILWIPVMLEDGTQGYVRQDAVTYLTQAEAESYVASQPQTPQEPQLPQEQLPVRESDYARVSIAGSQVKNDFGVLTGYVLAQNDVILLQADRINTMYHEGTELWVPFSRPSDGLSGYAKVNTLSFMSKQAEQEYLQSQQQQQQMPQIQSNYARIGMSGGTLRGANGQVLRTLASGTVVIYQPNIAVTYDGNKLLLYVTVDDGTGNSGYLLLDEASFMTALQESEYIASKTPSVPSPDRARYAYVLQNNVNVRPYPNSAPGAQVSASDVVYVTEVINDAAGDAWYHVQVVTSSISNTYMGYNGYIRYAASPEVLRYMSDAEELVFLDKQRVTPSPSPTPPLVQTRGYMRVIANGYTALNAFPAQGAAMIGVLQLSDVVFAQGQEYGSDGQIWSHVIPMSGGTQAGYVLSSSLRAMTDSELTAYFATARPSPSVAPTYSPLAFSGYAMLTKNSVNFRQSASTESGTYGRLAQGTIVRIIEETTADGYTWYKAESGGRTGYLRSDMLALLNIQEYQSLVTSPSYNQNGNIVTPTATVKPIGSFAPTWATPRPGQTSQITFVTIPPLSSATPDPNASPSPDASASASPDPLASPGASDGSLPSTITASPSPTPDTTLPPATDLEFPEDKSGGSISGLLIALIILAVLIAGGLYGYSVYNKTRKKQANDEARKLAAQNREGPEGSARPAVRRPTPPVQPPQGQQPRPQQPGQPNPYARPQGDPAARQGTQQPASNIPRAQVDGRPVGQPNPYARPASQQQGQQQARPSTPGAQGQQPPAQRNATPASGQPRPQQPGATQPSNDAGNQAYQRPRMPVAPPPVQPDAQAQATGGQQSQARRRRRPETEGSGNPPDQP